MDAAATWLHSTAVHDLLSPARNINVISQTSQTFSYIKSFQPIFQIEHTPETQLSLPLLRKSVSNFDMCHILHTIGLGFPHRTKLQIKLKRIRKEKVDSTRVLTSQMQLGGRESLLRKQLVRGKKYQQDSSRNPNCNSAKCSKSHILSQ